MTLFGAVLLLVALCMAIADETYYKSGEAAFMSNSNLDLNPPSLPSVAVSIFLSGDPFAGTDQQLYGTFKGAFSSSGPHALGILSQPGQQYDQSVVLDRKIGSLEGIWLEVRGPDSLLIQSVSCLLENIVYNFAVQQQWLEKWDPDLAASTGDGFSPDAGQVLPSSSTLYIPVTASYPFFADTGAQPPALP